MGAGLLAPAIQLQNSLPQILFSGIFGSETPIPVDRFLNERSMSLNHRQRFLLVLPWGYDWFFIDLAPVQPLDPAQQLGSATATVFPTR
jgi:hypothetical protein